MPLGSIRCLVFLVAGATAFAAEPVTTKNSLSDLSASIHDLSRRVSPAVVEIMVAGYGPTGDDAGRTSDQISRQRSTGSGVIVDPSGYIVTNAHVIKGAVSIKVVIGSPAAPGELQSLRRFDALIRGIDPESDIALLKIDAKNLPAIRFADSDMLAQGDVVLAIGSPMELRNSVSMGVVSAPARSIAEDNPVLYIQTDASINPGDSGGALVDSDGRLVGINTSIMSRSGGNEGIGFAIPGNVVQSVYRQLRKNGAASMGSLGMVVQNISPPLAAGLDLPAKQGVMIADVDQAGAAEKAGLQRRDVILTLDGIPVKTAGQFDNAIYRRKPGTKIAIGVQRGTSRISLNAEISERPARLESLSAMLSAARNLVPRLGIFCIEIDDKVARLIPEMRKPYGLLVAARSSEGQAGFIDLRPGDIIHAVNNNPVALLDFFRNKIDELKPGDPVAIQIERDGHLRYVAFEID